MRSYPRRLDGSCTRHHSHQAGYASTTQIASEYAERLRCKPLTGPTPRIRLSLVPTRVPNPDCEVRGQRRCVTGRGLRFSLPGKDPWDAADLEVGGDAHVSPLPVGFDPRLVIVFG